MRAIALAVVIALASQSLAQQAGKKLIEFGWDEPDASFLRQHITAMERTPFDGTVFHLTSDFLWQGWGKRAFSENDLAGAIADLKGARIERFTHNFLRFNVTPGDVDWFDDFGPILQNAKLAARIAKAGKARGVLFDIEQYNSLLFDYRKSRDAKTKTWQEYSEQVRKRGREVMEAFQEGYPDLTVFLTFGYSLPCAQTGGDKNKLAEVDYGLLSPLLDGMFEAARGETRIVDGFEISYGYKEDHQFDEAQTTVKQNVLPMCDVDPDKYRRHVSLSFGLWLDHDWRNKAWDVSDFGKNHFSPEQFEASLKKAMKTADEYVWIYTETPKWWTQPAGAMEKLPAVYVEAVRRARKAVDGKN